MRVVRVACPSCGGDLVIGESTTATTCGFCGSNIILDWEGQISAAVRLELGLTSLQAGEYDEATEHFTRALERNPRSRDAWFWRGVAAVLSRANRLYQRRHDLPIHVMTERPKISSEDFYLYESGLTDEEAVDTLTKWMSGLGSWVDGGCYLSNCVANNSIPLGPAMWCRDSESRWRGVFDQALRNVKKRKDID